MFRHSILWTLLVAAAGVVAGLLILLPGGPAHGAPGASSPRGAAACWEPVPNVGSGLLNSVSASAPDDVWAVGFSLDQSSLIKHWAGTQWQIVAHPDPSAASKVLSGVVAISRSDAWAVGSAWNNGPQDALIEHWDGNQWTIVPAPYPGSHDTQLLSVSGVAADDVWAVGWVQIGTAPTASLVEHWDGTQWSIVASPNPGASSNVLLSVAVVTANDVWAVGTADAQTLTEHWDGQQWRAIPSPNLPTADTLHGVWGAAANDAWAVGSAGVAPYRTLALHWDGVRWTIMPSPSPGSDAYYQDLAAIAGSGPQDISAVGKYTDVNGNTVSLIEHWDGSQWSVVPNAYPDQQHSWLYGIAMSATGTGWAVGSQTNQGPLIEHYPGACPVPASTPTPCALTWDRRYSPNIPSAENHLRAVTGVATDDVWAVGDAHHYNENAALLLHWDGAQWSSVPGAPPPAGALELDGAAALTANDVWAVGSVYTGTYYPLLEHWNGGQWTVVPAGGGGGSRLFGVAGVATDDVWAVGSAGSSGLIEHWDGLAWHVVPGPAVPGYYSVSARTAADAWAVGPGGTAHWDGQTWALVPDAGIGISLSGVAALGAADVWAVGYSPGGGSSFAEHWDGSAWTAVSVPAPPGSQGTALLSVAGLAANDVWAVGNYGATGTVRSQVLTMHWDGQNWNLGSPQYDYRATLAGVTALRGQGVTWAVGYLDNGPSGPDMTLAERSISCPPAATPTPGGTPRTPSATPRAPTASPTHTSVPTPPPCGLAWRPVNSPSPGSFDNFLYGVAVLAANDAWAVGATASNGSRTLAEHWDGTAWTVVPSPNLGSNDQFQSVAARATNDVWAAGYYTDAANHQTLIEHWDGTQWSIVDSPGPSSYYNELYGVVALAPADVWAVGQYLISGVRHTLAEHWDGTAWTVVPTPALAESYFWGVTATAANDVWAVGASVESHSYYPLVMHWDGTQWSIVDSPRLSGYSELYGVAAIGPADVWAAGLTLTSGGERVLLEHWDGTAWTVTPSPNPSNDSDKLFGVAAVSSSDVWAVGIMQDGTQHNLALVEHWDGTQWTVVPGPNPDPALNDLYGVAARGPSDAWAVGAGGGRRTLIAHYSDPCATPSATPYPSPTATSPRPPSPSVTATPSALATGAPAASPTAPLPPSATACPLQFSDVPASSPFYAYVHCLACRGIIGGYADGTFRPASPVTRGQAAKLVANAAGYSDPIPAGRQTFGDVPPGNPFWLFAERASAHGVLGGYADGTFHPYNVVTRGQTAKIVASAAGYTDVIPAGRQTFGDVAPGSSFWLFVERASAHGVMGGYADGTFRPYNNLTRGQAAKFVANGFFPGCQTPVQGR